MRACLMFLAPIRIACEALRSHGSWFINLYHIRSVFNGSLTEVSMASRPNSV